MEIFTQDFDITYDMLDVNGHVKPSALLRVISVISDNHALDLGLGYSELMARDIAFLLHRLRLQIAVMPKYRQVIRAQTWPNRIAGASFVRSGHFLAVSDDRQTTGNTLVAWTHTYTIVDMVKRKLLRPSALGVELPLLGLRGLDCNPDKLTIPEHMTPALQHTVSYSDMDCNQHMNHQVYADILMNALPHEHIQGGTIGEFTINFVHEALLGDVIDVDFGISPTGFLVRGCVGEKTCFLAALN